MITIPPFQNNGRRQPAFLKPPAEFCKMLPFQGHFCERVPRERIKAGRNQQDVRVKFDQRVKGPLHRRRMLCRIASRLDWPVEYIASRRHAAAWIARILVNRSKSYSFISKNDLFCAVAMMRIEVPDPNTFAACCERVIGGNRDRVQIAKTHRSGRSRVMAGRTHQREAFFTAQRQIYRTDRRSGSTSSVFFNSGIVRSITVEIDRLSKPVEVGLAMDSQNFLFGG